MQFIRNSVPISQFISKHHGIDGIYKKGKKWIIVEPKGGKYCKLAKTKGKGMQMSREWMRTSLKQAAANGDNTAKKVLADWTTPGMIEAVVVKSKLVNGVFQEPTFVSKSLDIIGNKF